jgi:signal transduction histidine kinase
MMKSVKENGGSDLATVTASLQSEIAQRRCLEVELLSAVEAERQRIGQDLHDDLCQRLGATALLAGSLAKEITKQDKEMGERVNQIPDLISEAIDSCRNVARGLHPVTLERDGLPAALEELGAKIPHDIVFSWTRSKRIDFERGVALHLYRIAEEAIGNALKHAKAKRITINLGTADGCATLSISDDGKGIASRTKSAGMGMRNMKYRANAIGATLTVEGKRGLGTTVTCVLPFGTNPSAGVCD